MPVLYESFENADLWAESEDKQMNKIMIKIDGMMCGMGEAHVCDAIRKAVPCEKKGFYGRQ